jgi:hypothetical protein
MDGVINLPLLCICDKSFSVGYRRDDKGLSRNEVFITEGIRNNYFSVKGCKTDSLNYLITCTVQGQDGKRLN